VKQNGAKHPHPLVFGSEIKPEPVKLTVAAVRAELAPLGITITKRDGEYVVRVKGSAQGEGYFTSDLADALATGKAMAKPAASVSAKASHTPAPWIVSRSNAGMVPVHFQPPEVLGRNGQCCVAASLGSGPEAEANAHLIAAAPELLAALKACAERMAKLQENTNYPLAWPRVMAECAINKAEGRA
jgi:hypothetical protein